MKKAFVQGVIQATVKPFTDENPGVKENELNHHSTEQDVQYCSLVARMRYKCT
jgi:hypothetical protein